MKKSLHEICVDAVNKMVAEDINQHVSYINGSECVGFALKEGGKIPKVTIEWVDGSEADPDNHKAG